MVPRNNLRKLGYPAATSERSEMICKWWSFTAENPMKSIMKSYISILDKNHEDMYIYNIYIYYIYNHIIHIT